MPVILSAIFSTATSFITGLFNFKGDQAKTLQGALEVLKSVDDNDSKSVVAMSSAISAILTQGSFLERNWRAVLMSACVLILLCSYFGYTPPHFNDQLTPMMQTIVELIKIGLGGYIVKGGVIDVVKMFNISSILKAYIAKKIT